MLEVISNYQNLTKVYCLSSLINLDNEVYR